MIELDKSKLKTFLVQLDVASYDIEKVAGDASFRSYYRVFDYNKSVNYILMFAPVEYEDTSPFIHVAEILLKNKLRAPRIFGIDSDNGFLLLEDFGDVSFNKSMAQNGPDHEKYLYQNSIDVLCKIYNFDNLDGFAQYNHGLLFQEVMLFVDWYLKFEKNVVLDHSQLKEFKDVFFELFDKINHRDKRLVLRDYHADNLMVIANQSGENSVGLLDFQDAVLGSAAYDLVSLLEDARRDVDPGLALEMFEYYLQKNELLDREQFETDYKILSLQRNVKILGIFARLAHRDNKKSYLDLIPRVRNYVRERLSKDDEVFSSASKLILELL